MQITLEEIHLKGISVSPGIAIGSLFFCHFNEDTIVERSITEYEIDEELMRYRLALEKSKVDLIKLRLALDCEKINEGMDILESHLQLLQDPVITDEIEQEIRVSHKCAEFVLQSALQRYKKKFNTLSVAFFRERFYDLQAIVRRIISCLKGEAKVFQPHTKAGLVYARELSFVDLTEATVSHAKGFITEINGATSHAAIAAKAKGIPFVTSISYEFLQEAIESDSIVIVDGNTGRCFYSSIS